jgi:hypothetical protein
MKRTLTFTFEDDDGDSEFNMISHASDSFFALYDLDQYLRDQLKYNSDAYTNEAQEALEKVRERLHEIMAEHNISFGMVS